MAETDTFTLPTASKSLPELSGQIGKLAPTAIKEYAQDFWQRSILFLDILRQRGNEREGMLARGVSSVLIYDTELVMRDASPGELLAAPGHPAGGRRGTPQAARLYVKRTEQQRQRAAAKRRGWNGTKRAQEWKWMAGQRVEIERMRTRKCLEKLERAKEIEPSTLSLGSGSKPEHVGSGWTPLDK